LGLVQGLDVDRHLGSALKTIAAFLGYEGRSFDITNGKYRTEPEPCPVGPGPADDPPF
jgi:hypothetical protein